MERYRTEHEGPVLKRASELFELITGGSYARLEADLDERDENVLYAVRPDGVRLTVDQMSDGTRDQLYLVLRLASLDLRLDDQANEPLPFIIDDVLVNFDNERAMATLQVMAKLALKTQVLFFTHHQHLVELGRTNLGMEKVHVVDFRNCA